MPHRPKNKRRKPKKRAPNRSGRSNYDEYMDRLGQRAAQLGYALFRSKGPHYHLVCIEDNRTLASSSKLKVIVQTLREVRDLSQTHSLTTPLPTSKKETRFALDPYMQPLTD